MDHQALSEQMSLWLEPTGRKLRRAVDRSEPLRLALLGIASASGGIIMLAPGIVLVCAAGSAAYLGNHIAGPLDWFLTASLVAVSLFAGFVGIQLYATKPALPTGIELVREREPKLFAMLDRRLAHFKMRPVDRVVLSSEAQLAIAATPRLPLPFLRAYTLSVGAPLMFFLSKGQFRLALAGAIAAATRNRDSLPGWIAQSSQDWPCIVRALEQSASFSSRLLLRPAKWIASITAALGGELLPDLQQAQGRWVLNNSDEDSAVDLLAKQVVACAFLEHLYWPMIFKAAQRAAAPVVQPFSHLPLLLARLLEDERARRWLLQAQTGTDATQFRLRDILSGLNIDHLHWTPLPEKNAFAAVFRSTDLLKQLDKDWQRSIETDWKRRYAQFQADKKRFQRLQEEASKKTLHGDSAIRYARLARRFLDKEGAAAICQDIYHNNLNDALLCMICGQEMLAVGESRRGCAALQRASELDATLANRAHALITAHRNAWLDDEEPAAQQAHSA